MSKPAACSVLVLQHVTFVRNVQIYPFSSISTIVLLLTPLDLNTDIALHNRLVKSLLAADSNPFPSLYQTPNIQLICTEGKTEIGFHVVPLIFEDCRAQLPPAVLKTLQIMLKKRYLIINSPFNVPLIFNPIIDVCT